MAKREAGAAAKPKSKAAKAKDKPKGAKMKGDNLVDMATAGRKKKAAAGTVPEGSNSGQPLIPGLLIVGAKDTEAFVTWEGKVVRQWKSLEKAKEIVRSETGGLNNLYGQMKEGGIPAHRISTLKKRLKLEARPIEDVIEEHRETAWQVSVVKVSNLRVHGLYEVAEPTLEGYEALGEKYGYEGGNVDNAPGRQGDDKYAHWMTGFKRGQKKLAEETFNAGKPVDTDGSEEEALVH